MEFKDLRQALCDDIVSSRNSIQTYLDEINEDTTAAEQWITSLLVNSLATTVTLLNMDLVSAKAHADAVLKTLDFIDAMKQITPPAPGPDDFNVDDFLKDLGKDVEGD
jgi:hypothetical protein